MMHMLVCVIGIAGSGIVIQHCGMLSESVPLFSACNMLLYIGDYASRHDSTVGDNILVCARADSYGSRLQGASEIVT